ncbi:hypothetical protein Y032_0020g96 [Ancylostoma ceylanicum]|uniref:Uncharacterized protein n=1 Tax=Ancylostoma ceylanicum TaxID=53326 RepID=A0A016V3H5_9BILA|nr:hypothetical protein Y032_0020g96 [Ancylostoma ceylanicum]
MDYDFVFKCAWKQVDLEFNQLFTKSNTIGITRGHNFRILRKKSFTSQRVDYHYNINCSPRRSPPIPVHQSEAGPGRVDGPTKLVSGAHFFLQCLAATALHTTSACSAGRPLLFLAMAPSLPQNLVDQGEHAPCSGYSTDNLLMNSSTKTTDGSQHIRAFSRLC